MKAAQRREELAEYLMKVGYARIDDLVEQFGISRMTVHRHVDTLARQGVLRRLHGAVTVQPSGLYESAFRYRVTVSRAEKLALARAALDYVEPGQAVMLDDSTTTAMVATVLDSVTPLTVITNSIASAECLAKVDDVDLFCLGGQFHRVYNAYIGLLCEHAIATLRVNVLFLSASAVQGTTAFIQDQQVVRVKQAMMAVAKKRVLLVDHQKFDKLALHVLGDLTMFDVVLTSERLPADQASALVQAGVKLRLVALGPES
jgi:DeoR/GlpR family transcriptional regulator of sugar metabolism